MGTYSVYMTKPSYHIAVMGYHVTIIKVYLLSKQDITEENQFIMSTMLL